ncbi:MAG: sulfatase-like hydrolase/transferase [Bacteroidetes bacterium]|nr:sulfatase-like hydrolase/transferase [Bacteroidota bacterium]
MAFGDLPRQPNILIIISDQQSAHPYWPAGWEEENLPAMQRLKNNGITFQRGYTNSCTCSPSRTTLFTGLYPSQHGVIEVLEFDSMSDPMEGGITSVKERRQRGLASNLQNMARMMKSAGYNVVYKGKWHLTKPVQYSNPLKQKYWTEADVAHLADRWGFDDWGFPDAGDNLKIANMGGGRTNNDGRFVDGNGQSAKYGYLPKELTERQSVLHFLENYNSDKPFCLIVSLVNPHDVLAYPGTGGAYITVDGKQIPLYEAAGYRNSDFDSLDIEAPPTAEESLLTKPRAQTEFRAVSNAGNGDIPAGSGDIQSYCQFYAYLCTVVDNEIMKVLNTLDSTGRTDDTIIFRISDHGDMAMSHGRQRQKMYNVYQETLNVPFIISNPLLYPTPQTTDSLAGLIDIMPTLATIAGVPNPESYIFKGKDLAPILANPTTEVQDFVHFTYDDLYFYVPGPNHIRCITEKGWKYAVYYDIYDGRQPEYEMYNLVADPSETRNLAFPSVFESLSPEMQAVVSGERARLHEKLTQAILDLGTMPDMITWPRGPGYDQLSSTDLPRNSPYIATNETEEMTSTA